MIIDCNVLFGFEIEKNIRLDIQKVIEIMDSKSIAKALITNVQCKFYDFTEGNSETAAIVAEYPDRFFGMASFNTSQYLNVEEEARRTIFSLGLSGIRLFNTDENFTSGWGGGIDSPQAHLVFDIIKGHGIPVFIEGGYPFGVIGSLASKYPDVPIIASGTGYGNIAEAMLTVKKNDNLYLDMSTLDSMDGVEILTRNIGADRIIFGTGLPYNAPSVGLLMVQTADVTDREKERILSGNMLDILAGRNI